MPSFAPGKDDDYIPNNTLIAWVGWMLDCRSDSKTVRECIDDLWPTANKGEADEDDPKRP